METELINGAVLMLGMVEVISVSMRNNGQRSDHSKKQNKNDG